jgi:hypothetical protein
MWSGGRSDSLVGLSGSGDGMATLSPVGWLVPDRAHAPLPPPGHVQTDPSLANAVVAGTRTTPGGGRNINRTFLNWVGKLVAAA